jgi:3-hydroxyisobutyrate dehydrogenase
MIKNDFAPGFYVEHFIKDLGIALEESRRMGLKTPGLELGQRLYQELAAQGHARSGTQALILALGKMGGVDWERR